MSSFSAEWLTLREPADARARSMRVTQAVVDALPQGRTIEVLDLAAGTGSNVRYLGEHLPGPQKWLLVDHDATLLAAVKGHGTQSVATRVADLSTLVADLSTPDAHAALFSGRDLVTASALLDLVSYDWLQNLTVRCRAAGAAVLFALSYDGRIVCTPEEPEDDLVRDLVNRHQRTDKGFGPALGPDAVRQTARVLEALGYHVVRASSDWVLGSDAHDLQRELIEGWAAAAAATAPAHVGAIEAWRVRRQEHLQQGRSRIVVGHEDLAGLVPTAG